MIRISEDARKRLLLDYLEDGFDPQAFTRSLMRIRAMSAEVFDVGMGRAIAFDARLDDLSGADQATVLRQLLAGASREEAIKSVDPGPPSAKAKWEIQALEEFYKLDLSDPAPVPPSSWSRN